MKLKKGERAVLLVLPKDLMFRVKLAATANHQTMRSWIEQAIEDRLSKDGVAVFQQVQRLFPK
jgi:hypothetical protein